jgi:uncharacterized protein
MRMLKPIRRALAAALPLLAAAALLLALLPSQAPPARGAEFYKMSTLGPGTTPYVISTAMAQIAKKYVGLEIQINATGAATRHAIDAARGNTDFFMSAPSVQHFMVNKLAMYKDLADAPELAKKLRGMFNFPIGVYHMVVYADSGIQSLKDIKGKRVFLGPPVGAARVVAEAIVQGSTGYEAGKDYSEAKLGWSAAEQAFQDRQIDLYINPTNAPSPVISQIALTNKIRLLGMSEEDFKNEAIIKMMKLPGRTREEIGPGVYGTNQLNTAPVTSVGAWVGIGTHEGVDAEVVYKITKAFWEHIDEVHAQAEWLKSVQLKDALREMNMPLHPGALRYYREKGIAVPAALVPPG